MKSIIEKAKEAERNTHPLFESIRESDGTPVSVYDQDDMISMFEQGANYVLEKIEEIIRYDKDPHVIEALKERIWRLKQ